MKTIKILIAIFFISTCNLFAQKHEIEIFPKFTIELKNSSISTLKLINLAGDVTITANNGSKIIVEADGLKSNPERAEGLKRIGSAGEDNTGVGLNFEEDGNSFTLIGAVSMNSNAKYKISVPEKLKINVELGMFNNGDLEITGLNSDLELDVKTSDIKLRDITGPTVISSLSGDIDIVFSKLNQSSPFSIKVISGEIDISLPANTPANLELSSMSGGIYTDFDIKTTNNNSEDLTHIGGGTEVQAKINGGGVKMVINTISGNVYLRKKK